MKPNELIKLYNMSYDGNKIYFGNSTFRAVKKYADTDCVMGYYRDKAELMTVIVIDGTIKSFIITKARMGGFLHLYKEEHHSFTELFNTVSKHGKITNKRAWNKNLKRIMISKITKG